METPPACEEESGPVTTSATPETVSTHHLPRRLALPDDVLTTKYDGDIDVICN